MQTLVAQLDQRQGLAFCDGTCLPWQDHEESPPFLKSG